MYPQISLLEMNDMKCENNILFNSVSLQYLKKNFNGIKSIGYLEFIVYNERRSSSSFSSFYHQIKLILFMGFFGCFFFFRISVLCLLSFFIYIVSSCVWFGRGHKQAYYRLLNMLYMYHNNYISLIWMIKKLLSDLHKKLYNFLDLNFFF